MIRRVAAALLALVLLAGCSTDKMLEKMTTERDRAVALYYLDLLRDGRYSLIERDIDPSLKTPDLRENLKRLGDMIPVEKPLSVKLVGANQFTNTKATTTTLVYEYRYPDLAVLANVTTRTMANGPFHLVGLQVVPQTEEMRQQNSFTLAGRSPGQYVLLALCVINPLFIISAIVVCIRSRVRWRWLWVLFILPGIGTISVNWATNQWYFMPLSFQLLGVGASSDAYSPWVLAVSFPLGAIIFFLTRISWRSFTLRRVWWCLYAWPITLLLLSFTFSELKEKGTPLVYFDAAMCLPTLLVLHLHIWDRRFLPGVVWKVYSFVTIIWSTYYSIFLDLPDPSAGNSAMMIAGSLFLLLPLYVALFRYAFRKWDKPADIPPPLE